jgi:hypothetical protein
MAQFNVRRLTALPGSPAANTIYVINPPGEADYAEVYITGNSGATIRRIINETDISALIAAAVGAMTMLHIVANIAARDALSLAGNGNAFVLVTDASADITVASGAALYAFNDTGDTFTKLTEYESLDLVLDWADIQNKPASSTTNIDDAVNKRHEHTNMTQLNKVGQDGEGHFTYDGVRPTIEWTEVTW